MRAKRQLDREVAWWDENRPAAYGALDAEVLDALRLLADHPYIGVGQASGGEHARKLLLRTTGLWLRYRVYPRRGTLLITKLVPARRG